MSDELEKIALEMAKELNEVNSNLCIFHKMEGKKKCSRDIALDKFVKWWRKNHK